MQIGLRETISSLPATQFREALAPGAASAMNSIQLPWSQAQRTLLHSLAIVSIDNCAWEINVFRSVAGLTSDPSTDTWIGEWRFLETSARQIPGSTLWRYYIGGLDQALYDADNANTGTPVWNGRAANPWNIYAILVNRSGVTAKGAGDAGLIKVAFTIEAMQENA